MLDTTWPKVPSVLQKEKSVSTSKKENDVATELARWKAVKQPSKEEEFECPVCGKKGIQSEILQHIDGCRGLGAPPAPHVISSAVPELEWFDADFAKVIEPYDPKDSIELKLKLGDIVKIIFRQQSGWYKGELRQEVGIFPISHCIPTTEKPQQNFMQSSEPNNKKEKKGSSLLIPKVSTKEDMKKLRKLGIQQQYKEMSLTGRKSADISMSTSQRNKRLEEKKTPGTRAPIQPSKRFLIRFRDDERSWMKIELRIVTIKELYEVCAKRLRVDTVRIFEIHTATVLDDVTGKADLQFCKALKQDSDVTKQPNGTFLEVILLDDFDLERFLQQYHSYFKKNLKDLINICEERRMDSSELVSKVEIIDALIGKDFQPLTIKQVMTVADKLGVDWDKCETKLEIIKAIKIFKK